MLPLLDTLLLLDSLKQKQKITDWPDHTQTMSTLNNQMQGNLIYSQPYYLRMETNGN